MTIMYAKLTIKDLRRTELVRSWTRRFNVFQKVGTMTTEQLLHNVRYLKPVFFRNTMDYNNVMFIVAGEVIHKISGKTWAEFIEENYETCWDDIQVLVLITEQNLLKIKLTHMLQSMEKQLQFLTIGTETSQCNGGILSKHYRHDDLGKFLNEWFCNQRRKTFGFRKKINICGNSTTHSYGC